RTAEPRGGRGGGARGTGGARGCARSSRCRPGGRTTPRPRRRRCTGPTPRGFVGDGRWSSWNAPGFLLGWRSVGHGRCMGGGGRGYGPRGRPRGPTGCEVRGGAGTTTSPPEDHFNLPRHLHGYPVNPR